MKNVKNIIAVTLLSLTATSAFAHDDEINVQIQYNLQRDNATITNLAGEGPVQDIDNEHWLFSYYLNGLDFSRGPKAEAAFMSKTGSLTLAGGGDESSVGFEYFGDNLYVRLQNEDGKHDWWHFGWLPGEDWLTAIKVGDDRLGIYSKSIMPLMDNNYLGIELGYEYQDDEPEWAGFEHRYYGDLDYYLSEDLSVGCRFHTIPVAWKMTLW